MCVNNATINFSTSVRDLGVILDNDVSFEQHLSNYLLVDLNVKNKTDAD